MITTAVLDRSATHHRRVGHSTGSRSGAPRLRRTAAAMVGVAALLAACGGSDGGDSGSVDLASAIASAAVCNGEPSDVNPPSSDPFSGYVYLSDGDGWTSGWFDAFGDQQAIVGDDATAILCATVTSSTEAERCDYEEDGEAFTLVMASAEYELELRNADTASVIANGSVTAEAEDCPIIASWTEGEGERTSYPRPSDDELATVVGPFTG